jgi:hypothetical protein
MQRHPNPSGTQPSRIRRTRPTPLGVRPSTVPPGPTRSTSTASRRPATRRTSLCTGADPHRPGQGTPGVADRADRRRRSRNRRLAQTPLTLGRPTRRAGVSWHPVRGSDNSALQPSRRATPAIGTPDMIPFICPTCGQFDIDTADCASCNRPQGAPDSAAGTHERARGNR